MGSSADKLLSFVNAYIEFVAGEQPTADKFNALVAQTKYGFNGLERAVGDIWTTTYAFGEENAHLSTQWGPNYTTGGYVSSTDDVGRALDIVNIGRAIGPMSNLNPLILSPEGGTSIAGENAVEGVHEFTLRYIPLEPSNVVFTLSDGTTPSEFSTWAGTPEAINSTGQYHVTDYGCVYTYDETPSGVTIDYDTDPNYWGGGPNPPNARFNVIPDPNQFGDAGEYLRITFEDTTGNYYVVLPQVRSQQNNHTNDTANLSDIDSNFNLPILLPEVITENFEPGQAIPEGFIYIRNVTRGETFIDATYSYNDENTLVVSDVDLHGDDSSILNDEQWVLFTVGTDITSNVNDVQQKMYKHSHSRAFGEPPVHVSDLAGIYEAQKDATSHYGPSSMDGNWFSQYLHRDGYQTDTNSSNNNNAMRGDLILGITQDAGGTSTGSREYLSETGESYRIGFGNPYAENAAPVIWRDTAETLRIRGQQQGVPSEEKTPNKEASWEDDDQSITLDSRGSLILTTEHAENGGATGIYSGAIRLIADSEWAPSSFSEEGTSLSKGGMRFESSANTQHECGRNWNLEVQGQINIESVTSDIKVDAAADIEFDAGDDFRIDAADNIQLEMMGTGGDDCMQFKTQWSGTGGAGKVVFAGMGHSRVSGSTAFQQGDINEQAAFFNVVAQHEDGPVCKIANTTKPAHDSPGNNPTLLTLDFCLANPFYLGEENAQYIDFACMKGSTYSKPEHLGRIFCTGDSGTDILRVTDGDGNFADDGGPDTEFVGSVRYESGNHDFGEWFELGDIKEFQTVYGWTDEEVAKMKEAPISGGTLLYLRDRKAYHSGPGLQCIVSKQAAFLGNGHISQNKDVPIIIVCMIGQINTIIRGKIANGDYVIPYSDDANYCKGVKPEDMDFDTYKKVLGRCIEDYSKGYKHNINGIDDDFYTVDCLIGVK